MSEEGLNEYLSRQVITLGISGGRLNIVGGAVNFSQELSPELLANLLAVGYEAGRISHAHAFSTVPVVGDLGAD